MIRIIGAGLAGCLAGILMPNALLYEAAPDATALTKHKAVLRFREPKISEALGIPFRRVTVHKSVFDDGRHSQWATPAQQNAYARKVIGCIIPRSINDLRTVDRWVAPTDLHEQMLNMVASRAHWGHKLNFLNEHVMHCGVGDDVEFASNRNGDPIISTIPLPVLLDAIQPPIPWPNYDLPRRASIHVERYFVRGCDVHQTVYFPSDKTSLYRATLTGGDLIIESTIQLAPETDSMRMAFEAFGLSERDAEFVETTAHKFGKIVELPNEIRKPLLLQITLQANVYSLGRFATFRNVLLDDVYNDLYRIREMMSMSHYDLHKRAAAV